MNIEALKFQNAMQLQDDKKTVNNSNALFEDFYNAAIGVFNNTNSLQLEAEQLQVDFASGKSDDYLGMLIAQSKASTALQFTVQVTNKIVESYKEIMRMQV